MPLPGASDGLSASPQLPSLTVSARGARVESPIRTMLAAVEAREMATTVSAISFFMVKIIADHPCRWQEEQIVHEAENMVY